jgi:hypothetical protein
MTGDLTFNLDKCLTKILLKGPRIEYNEATSLLRERLKGLEK